ncbi:YibE/F family protein [Carnobacterium funditum]|uniref:YibE/F family protein n=1 Tax=Carnobacterium funditum TaxID=2752 RepID=UPI0005544C3A|nr:YibE/F family protein [Carnobacterium funditum]
MNVLVFLMIILFILMKLIGGEKGVRSFTALFLNFCVLFVTVFFMTVQTFNPIFITLIASIIISCINLFYINRINLKSITAFVATLITLLLLIALIFIIVERAMLQGFGIEEIEDLTSFTLYVGVDFVAIAICTIIMGAIGAITDTAISISSAMNEIYIRNPLLNRYDLFKSGMNVGKDILGTTTNTLFFAFIGGYLALILWFKDLAYTFGEVINSKVFSSEIVSIFCIGTGAILIIPITAWLAAYLLTKYKDKVPAN